MWCLGGFFNFLLKFSRFGPAPISWIFSQAWPGIIVTNEPGPGLKILARANLYLKRFSDIWRKWCISTPSIGDFLKYNLFYLLLLLVKYSISPKSHSYKPQIFIIVWSVSKVVLKLKRLFDATIFIRTWKISIWTAMNFSLVRLSFYIYSKH